MAAITAPISEVQLYSVLGSFISVLYLKNYIYAKICRQNYLKCCLNYTNDCRDIGIDWSIYSQFRNDIYRKYSIRAIITCYFSETFKLGDGFIRIIRCKNRISNYKTIHPGIP